VDVVLETSGEDRRAKHLRSGEPITIGSVEKMSKSKKNVVDPDEIVATYGADTARWFMLSDSPPERDVQWTEAGVEGAHRFVQRVWKLVAESIEITEQSSAAVHGDDPEVLAIRKAAHRVVRQVAEDIEGLRFNRAVAQIYELTNALTRFQQLVIEAPSPARVAMLRDGMVRLVQMIAPMMPHLAETGWAALGQPGLVADAPWPSVDPAMLVDDEVTIPVQVNGKLRSSITVPIGAPRENIEQLVLSLEPVARMLEGKSPKKIIIVPDRIVNVVI
jgi:leucyl-tRNA synthetase